jgi:hypothetical protein
VVNNSILQGKAPTVEQHRLGRLNGGEVGEDGSARKPFLIHPNKKLNNITTYFWVKQSDESSKLFTFEILFGTGTYDSRFLLQSIVKEKKVMPIVFDNPAVSNPLTPVDEAIPARFVNNTRIKEVRRAHGASPVVANQILDKHKIEALWLLPIVQTDDAAGKILNWMESFRAAVAATGIEVTHSEMCVDANSMLFFESLYWGSRDYPSTPSTPVK